jgi:hypothetical protein
MCNLGKIFILEFSLSCKLINHSFPNIYLYELCVDVASALLKLVQAL